MLITIPHISTQLLICSALLLENTFNKIQLDFLLPQLQYISVQVYRDKLLILKIQFTTQCLLFINFIQTYREYLREKGCESRYVLLQPQPRGFSKDNSKQQHSSYLARLDLPRRFNF